MPARTSCELIRGEIPDLAGVHACQSMPLGVRSSSLNRLFAARFVSFEKPIELVPTRSARCNEQSRDQREKAKKALAQATGTESVRGDDEGVRERPYGRRFGLTARTAKGFSVSSPAAGP
jgi:hypothetical protein